MELLPYNEQTSRELLPVGRIIADKKGILTLRDNELGDVHSGKGRVMNAEIWYRRKVEVAHRATERWAMGTKEARCCETL